MNILQSNKSISASKLTSNMTISTAKIATWTFCNQTWPFIDLIRPFWWPTWSSEQIVHSTKGDFTKAEWCSGIAPAFRAGGAGFDSRSHNKRYFLFQFSLVIQRRKFNSLTFALVRQPHGSSSRMYEYSSNHKWGINGKVYIYIYIYIRVYRLRCLGRLK